MEGLSPAYFRSRVLVYLQNRQGVRRTCSQTIVAEKILEAVWEAVAKGNTCLRFKRGVNTLFECDLQKMKLVNLSSFEEEDILLEFQWDPKSFVSILAQKGDRIVARKVLVMALERFRRKLKLRKILALKGLPTCAIRENPYLRLGHPPHDNFVESLLDYFEKETDGGGDGGSKKKCPLLEYFLESAADDAEAESFVAMERGGIQIVFHGTNHAVMEAILLSGLDPKCRSGQLKEDYFGIVYNLSLNYTRRKTNLSTSIPPKLLVFMVLNPPLDERTNWSRSPFVNSQNCVTISSNKFQLPIAEITLCETLEEL